MRKGFCGISKEFIERIYVVFNHINCYKISMIIENSFENFINSFYSTFNKANVIEPLTLAVLKLADVSETRGHSIRRLVIFTSLIDHIIKAVAVPFVEIFDYFNDLYNEQNSIKKILKCIVTVVW